MTNFFARYSQELSVAFLVCLALAVLSSLVWIMARKRMGLRISPWQIALCAALLMALALLIIFVILAGSNANPPLSSPNSITP